MSRALVVSRHVLRAHGAMYRALKAVLPVDVPVGIVHAMPYFEAFDPSHERDRAAATSQDWFMNQWYIDGLTTGRIAPPVGTGEEEPGLRDSFDVFGLNYYSRMLVHEEPEARPGLPPLGLRRPGERPEFVDEMGWEVYPPGLGHHLRRLATLGKPLMVTENGHATLDEEARVRYLRAHLAEVHGAIQAGADVRGYFYWSLMDNFEWAEGWTRHFGLLAVDPQTLGRTPRPAALWYRDVIHRNALPPLA
jgi:beta-glucosidase